MEIERQRKALDRLGLSTHQAEVYLKLLQRGPLGAAELASAVGVPRTSVYEITKTLEEMGLVAGTLDTPTRFRALPIREYVEHERERLRAQEADLVERLPELEGVLGVVVQRDDDGDLESPGSVTTLRGERVVRRKLAAALGGAQREILVILGPVVLPRLNAHLVERCSAGVEVRVLQHVDAGTINPCLRMVEAGGAVRHIPTPGRLTTIVVDGRECLIAFPSGGQGGKQPTAGLWTDEPHFTQAQAANFLDAWTSAVPLGDRQRQLEIGEAPRTTDLVHPDTEGDAEANARVFLDAVQRTVEGATTTLDIALPDISTLAFDWDVLFRRLGDVRGRVLAPLPRDEADERILDELFSLADVREAPPDLRDQALVIADVGQCLIATLARSGRRPTGARWESVIMSTQRGLVAASRTHFEAVWATALDLQEAVRASGTESGRWWFTSRRAEDARLWAREAVSTAVRSVRVRAEPLAMAVLPLMVRGLRPGVHVETTAEPEGFGALVVVVDDHLCLVVEDPEVEDAPEPDERRLQRVGHVTFTNNPATLRAWSSGGTHDGARRTGH